jgi:hypothetical protein
LRSADPLFQLSSSVPVTLGDRLSGATHTVENNCQRLPAIRHRKDATLVSDYVPARRATPTAFAWMRLGDYGVAATVSLRRRLAGRQLKRTLGSRRRTLTLCLADDVRNSGKPGVKLSDFRRASPNCAATFHLRSAFASSKPRRLEQKSPTNSHSGMRFPENFAVSSTTDPLTKRRCPRSEADRFERPDL